MKIEFKLQGRVIPATLADNAAAQAFAAMLPLTITMHDLFKREKFGALPGCISAEPTRTAVCEAGDMICWTAGPDLTIFHRQDGQPTRGGFQVLGRLDFGAEAFGAPGPLEVSIAMANDPVRIERRRRTASMAGQTGA